MYEVADIERQSGLSRKQVYDRLKVLEPLLHDHTTTGRHGRKLLSEQGFSIFNRLVSLENNGHTFESAVNQIHNELPTPNGSDKTHSLGDGESNVTSDARDALIEELRSRIGDKDKEIEWLRNLIESQSTQIQTMLPANSQGRLSRWRHLRAVFLGR